MKLSGLAACMLIAAVVLPWLSFWMLPLAALVFIGSGTFIPKRFRWLCFAFPLCLLWVFWRGTPGEKDLRSILHPQPQSIRLRFQVRGDSDEMTFPGRQPEQRTPVRCLSVYQFGDWREAPGRMQLRMPPEQDPGFLTGSVWEATGVISPDRLPYVGLFRSDWKFVPDPGSIRPVDGTSEGFFLQRFFRAREFLALGIQKVCPDQPQVAATLQALLLGQRNELDREILQRFVRTGLVHVFAVSGLHLGLLTAMLLFVCKWSGVSPRGIYLVVLPVLMLFTLYTGLRASALRALIMIACLLLAPPLYRKARLQSSFALALILILAIAPAQVYDLGFQYSFLLVGSLLAFARLCSEKIRVRFAGDPWAVPTSGRRFRERHIWPHVQGALVVSGLCFVISAPLTAYTFNLFSPIGLLGNLLAVPLVFLLLASGFPALLTLLLPAAISEWAFLPARWSAQALLSWVEMLEKVPGGTQWVKAPALWMLLCFYGLLFCWWKWPLHKAKVLAALLVLAGYAGTTAWLDARQPELGVIHAGRGQAAWFRAPGQGIVLVDTGSGWSGYSVVKSLQQQGVDRIDSLIFTHPDRNHVEGFEHVRAWLRPERIYVAAADADHPHFADVEPEPGLLSRGDRLTLAGWTLEVLHPPENADAGSADDRSLVLRFSKGFSSVLLMGGAGGEVEEEILEWVQPLAARLLMSGNPRRGDLLRTEFLKKVQPEAVLFSGEGFSGITPGREEAEAEVFKLGLPVFRVDSGPLWILDPERGRYSRKKAQE